MTPEGHASDKVRLRCSQWQMKLFRNNSGALPNPKTGRPIRFGLGNESKKLDKEFKSGDYVGIAPVQITQEMVGKTIGVFVNIEVKTEGFVIHKNSREIAQQNFINMIVNLGGLAGFACNEDDVDRLVSEFFNRLLMK